MYKERTNTLYLYRILHEYSDADHILTMREIIGKFKALYDTTIDRRTVYSAVDLLKFLGYEISAYEDNGTGYYLVTREFEPSEIRLLTDAVCSFPFISEKQTKELVEKIQKAGSVYDRKRYKHLEVLRQEKRPDNRQMFLNIDLLEEAMEKGVQVEFSYCTFGTDRRLHEKENEDGSVRRYRVNPYRMVVANNRYYLVGNFDVYENISHYRIDRIRDIRILETAAKPSSEVEEFHPDRHMAEHIYMFSGKSATVTFLAESNLIGEVMDCFGTGVRLREGGNAKIEVRVDVNEEAMFYWLLQFGPSVEVLEPVALRNRVKSAAIGMAEKYSEERV